MLSLLCGCAGGESLPSYFSSDSSLKSDSTQYSSISISSAKSPSPGSFSEQQQSSLSSHIDQPVLLDRLGNPFPTVPDGTSEKDIVNEFLERFSYDYCPNLSDFDFFSGLSPSTESYNFCLSPDKLAIAKQSQYPDASKITEIVSIGSICALKDSDNAFYAWGYNSFGAIGDGTNIIRHAPYRYNSEFTYLFLNGRCGYAIDSSGVLYGWGDGASGQLGLGDEARTRLHLTPEVIYLPKSVKKISSRGWCTIALAEDGTLLRAGMRAEGFTHSMDTSLNYIEPLQPLATSFEEFPTPETIVDIACGSSNYVVLGESGRVYITGLLGNYYGPCRYEEWTAIPFPRPVSKIYASSEAVWALGIDNTLYGFGSNNIDAILYPCEHDYDFTEEPIVLFENVKDASMGNGSYLVLTMDGNCYAWGWNAYGQLGLGKEYVTGEDSVIYKPLLVDLPEPAVQVSNGRTTSMALGESGQVYVWGRNNFNQRLEPGFTPESVRDIPFEDRVGDEWTIYEPVPMGKAASDSVFEGKSLD